MTSQAKNPNIEIFENMPVSKAVRTMAIPTIIGQLIVLFCNITDTFFIGQTNDPYMVAGASLILPIYNITLSLAGLSGVGGGALLSRLLGAKQTEEAKRVYSFSVYLSIVIAGLFSALTFIFMHPLMNALGAGEETFRYARGYAMCVIVAGAIPTVLSNTLSSMLRSVGESKRAGLGVTMGGLINIGLDPIFMFVLFPKGMEIVGAGAATCLSMCISCLYFVVVILRLERRGGSVLHLCPPSQMPAGQSIRGIFGVGFPSGIATLLFDLDYVVLDKLMSAYGDMALAAVGIVLKVERLPLNVGIGICQGMVPIVAYNYSSGNVDRMKKTKNYARMAGLLFAAASVLMYELLAGPIMHLFINNADTVAIGTNFLRIRVLATPLMFLSFFHVHLFNAFGEGKYALFLGVTRWVVFNIPMLFILNYLIGMYGLVWSQITADVFTVALSLAVYIWFERNRMRS